jgi:radical SAM superfamily enzyme YgiQ (UPF0313 family)
MENNIELDDKHLKIMEAILPYARPTQQKKLTDLIITNVSRKTKVLFLLLPEWATKFPPYNLARLLAVTRNAGYHTNAFDLNVKAWRQHRAWEIDFDPWHGSKEWKWMGESYHQDLHNHMLPLLEEYLNYIGENNINVVGFSLYYCNQEPTDWMAKEIKNRYPHVTIIVGGPQCHSFIPESNKNYYDYVVSGEGEQIILDILEKIENNIKNEETIVIKQKEGERLNLDNMPRADYSDFNFSEYMMPNGINAEFSRGCTAKCVFCSETHFWKFRGRSSGGLLEEVIDLYNRYNINYIWFLDSLVNGNLKELRAFCKGIISSGVKINWTGYSRCDKRMDLEFFKDLANSGCHMLSYGIESGSNNVLKDMDKRVTVDEIEQNLKDSSEVGIKAHTNWIVGFPTEGLQEIFESMTLVCRNRFYIDSISGGHGFTEPPDTILSQNSEKYGMIKSYYMDNWITRDFKNSKVHRMIRLIAFNILLNNSPSNSSNFANFNTSKYYKIKYSDDKKFNNVNYEIFNFNLIFPNINPLADSVVNEIWPLLRLLWKFRGGYSINIKITPELSKSEFGNRLGCDLTAEYIFSIDDLGNWVANFNFDFQQDPNAWKYQDYSRWDSTAAHRARILANPGSNGEITWNLKKYDLDLKKLEELKELDFSFKYNWISSGEWI